MLAPKRFIIDEFIVATKLVNSKHRLYDLLVESFECFGFDRLVFSIAYDPELEDAHCGVALISTYPPDWQRRYLELEYARIDPVLQQVTGVAPPFWWRDLHRQVKLTPRQRAFLKDGEAAGIHNGLAVPFRGPAVQRAGIALATSSRQLSQPVDIDVIVALSNHFYQVYKRLCGKQARLIETASLSTREAEILVRAAHGRTDAEIANVLGIQPTTIHYHWRGIFHKLSASTRAQAVGYAIKYGIIDL